MVITQESGRFFVEQDGKLLAEITFINPRPDCLIIDHTFVDVSLRGHGMGRQLVAAVVTFARKENKKLAATCSFAWKLLGQNPDYEETIIKAQ